MKRAAGLGYGLGCYFLFLVSFSYAIGFVGDFGVPKTINSGSSSGTGWALAVNLALLGLFAVQHSVMAREGFKRWWVRVIPRSMERSTYVLFSSLVLLLLFWQWRPLESVVWSAPVGWPSILLWTLFGLGWFIVVGSTFLIDHGDLFGLRQAWAYFRYESYEYPSFQVTGLYRIVRHPIMFGFLLAFWTVPRMTLGNLVFAVMTTLYIVVGVTLEERDLLRRFGESYRRYRRNTAMLIPGLPGRYSPEESKRPGDDDPPQH